jgi:hypothetical protein
MGSKVSSDEQIYRSARREGWPRSDINPLTFVRRATENLKEAYLLFQKDELSRSIALQKCIEAHRLITAVIIDVKAVDKKREECICEDIEND